MVSCSACRRTFKTIHGLRGHEQFKHRGMSSISSREEHGDYLVSSRAAGEQLQCRPDVTALDPFTARAGVGSVADRCAVLEQALAGFKRQQRELLQLLRRDPETGCLVLDDVGAQAWGFRIEHTSDLDDVE